MKNHTQLPIFVGCALVLVAASAIAAPRSVSNKGREYIVNTSMLSPLSIGAYYENIEREVQIDGFDRPMEMRGMNGYLGYDVLSWATVFGTFGRTETSFGSGEYEDGEPQFGFGLNINILDQDILDPTLFEDKLRLNFDIHYTFSQSDYGLQGSLEWSELYTSLTLGIVNDVVGNKFFLPFAITIFGGPVFSDLEGDVEEKDEFGFVAGMDIFMTERVQLTGQVWGYDDDSLSVNGAIGIRF